MDRGQTMTTLFTERIPFQSWRKTLPRNIQVGFVPTMGALHAGHISLIEQAKRECDFVVVSIYVNGLQFNSETDYNNYPRTVESDFQMCSDAGVNAVFAPLRLEVFPEDTVELITPSLNAQGYEGADRPGHFAGVVTVVDRLFSLVHPSNAYFGLKDYQQVAVIKDMSRRLHPTIAIRTSETVRETDGLAISSRNRFLTENGRISASALPSALNKAIKLWQGGICKSADLVNDVFDELSRHPAIDVDRKSVV